MDFDQRDVNTALIHLYRGELQRMVTYRVRLDTTTNWAIGTAAALISFALGHDGAPHFVLVLGVLMGLVFAWIEARRFQVFELIRLRVRLLERGFYGDLLELHPPVEWEAELGESLRRPKPPVSLLQAMSVRMRRNYLWVIGLLYSAWLLKLHLMGGSFFEAATIGPLPGSWVVAASIMLVSPFVALAFVYRGRERG
ncbi:MAG: DUF2270 domain-containing protein [Myxococcota bacterium]|nr:DUF2270 domain-containing protein [Myxococcota bacterium]